ncbi:MAG: hypothetical protein LBH28_09590 [Oscillospiraceae bacterium]|nr:hypothetical protein [Oscillospiraceae bacterium]
MIVIDEEFKSLLPVLDKETYEILEANILENGCRDSLVLWNDILIDGHNRYEICTKHDISFNTVNKEFNTREEALIWIISTQVSRRNLTAIQLSHYRGLHYKAEKKIVKNEGGKNQHNEVKYQNETKPQSQTTAERLADQYNVSRATINRDARIAEAIDAIGDVSAEAKRKILSGEVKIDKRELEEISSRSKEEISEIAAEIEEGIYEKKKHATSEAMKRGDATDPGQSGTRQLDAVISDMSDGFLSVLRKHTKDGNTAELRSALRAYINMLEDLYLQI